MWFLVIGLILVGLKLAEAPLVSGWPWWMVLLPFGATVLWWLFADATGLTARREQQRWLNRRDKRRRETVEKLHTPQASDGRRVQRHDPTVGDKR
jgi:small Trp-rich protein